MCGHLPVCCIDENNNKAKNNGKSAFACATYNHLFTYP